MTAWQAYGGRGATGVWLVGARGAVAATAIAGAAALSAGLVRPTGCVTARREFLPLDLPRFDELVFGGHDIARTSLPERAERLVGEGVLPPGLPRLVRGELLAAEKEIRPGVTGADGPFDQLEAVRGLTDDLVSFRRRWSLERVVVLDVSSTAPAAARCPARLSLPELRRALASGESVLPDGSLYACAALRADCSYVDLTASADLRLPALRELAAERGLPYAGSAVRTGETLLRSVLAPMFTQRALAVRSWSGTCPGGGDGAGDGPPDRVDRVLFEGFLGTQMTLRLAWQGCEPALVAPLALDLARLMALADRAGVQGPVPQLAFFFGDPLPGGPSGGDRAAPAEQYATLVEWAHGLRVPA
ncbi:inositol-3-phosphate synthase [Streptomyces sp. TRM 70361]|uniref:inositol-3-phosphate synthase n=1 Tax=Streptomyces sp. TRM 70361 TaxID=3116553 RepID=UPI002E7AE2E9|nr:inositol-3-phosphate synthase [Streptomyces sp. TRM 70361]MEE1942228.1 inositol-3-phosphate synthase [Streptomyces sp. TRM 70361]